jgi:BirA family transcriptional regulator, biotin operon repressor / biotin---[acetyl-CoA-carboxylase] ligase
MSASAERIPGSPAWPGSYVELRSSTGSTMDDAYALARSGAPDGSAVAAGYQERGRGRVPGRTWVSPPGESLLVTVLVRAAALGYALPELPLRAGVAAARAVEASCGLRVEIKWPNDLVAQGRKLAGLLCEARGGIALVGIGVNCLQESFPDDLAMPAVSLRQAAGRAVPPRELLPHVLDALAAVASDPAWRDELNARLYRRGQGVTVDLIGAGRSVSGVVRDVDGQGRLVLALPGGETTAVEQGEIRPGR